MKLVSILPAILASLGASSSRDAPPPSTSISVYVLKPSNPALTTALTSALNTLGYRYTYSPFDLGLDLDLKADRTREDGEAARGYNGKLLTYTVIPLSGATTYETIALADPSARFILPVTSSSSRTVVSSTSNAWHGLLQRTYLGWEDPDTGSEDEDSDTEAIRAFFADDRNISRVDGEKPRLLVLDVYPSESHAQAEAWIALCDFLGLGYSVVERQRLWRFPV
ncbi:hypothetical protein F5Y17DRAFT_420697 [Xylariaceae sp. FL0594]|nr:hypothetical protein F5Y17DRAFT_420697 [Xylariaceae sp. FL0594]